MSERKAMAEENVDLGARIGAEQLAERLASLLARETSWGKTSIEGLARLSGGASRDTWTFDAVEENGNRHSLILQRQRYLVAGTDSTAMLEAQAFQAAAAVGVPAAGLVAASDDPEDVGAAYLLVDRIEGESIPQKILREPRFAPARAKLARQYGEALGRIQKIAPSDIKNLKAQDALKDNVRRINEIGEPYPALEFGLRWLDSNRPPAGDSVVVHGDFRNGNGIVHPEHGLRAVIDWELVHLGDPLEDLGWFCIRAWRFGEDLPAGGFGTYDEIIEGFESTSGRTVDREALRWWQIMGSLRWAVICLFQGAAHWQGRRRSLELAVTGRRAAEAEFDLMMLLP